MNDATPALLAARGLSKTYPDGQVHALAGVDLTVERRDYLAIMGPSGSGKSTLLQILGGLDRPDQGQVCVDGRPLETWPSLDAYRARMVGFVFQSFFLVPTLTALENVQLPMFEIQLSPRQRLDRARSLLDRVGLSDRRNHRPSQLSVGQRQRVAIARALANEPPLLLADEPTGNLDSATAADILGLFRDLRRDNDLTLLLVTHSAEVAAEADRVVTIRDGRVV
ncbi:MAG TPA: ABC transporter ATP-binding protein [Pirellulaceae bacterium]